MYENFEYLYEIKSRTCCCDIKRLKKQEVLPCFDTNKNNLKSKLVLRAVILPNFICAIFT